MLFAALYLGINTLYTAGMTPATWSAPAYYWVVFGMMLRATAAGMLFAGACGTYADAGWGRHSTVGAGGLLVLIQAIDAVVTFGYVIPDMGRKTWFIFGLSLPSFDAWSFSEFSSFAYCICGGYGLINIMIFSRSSVRSALP